MRLFLLSALTMVAFAANSILTRVALVDGSIDVVSFGALRLGAGAAILGVLCLLLGKRAQVFSVRRMVSIIGLLLYIGGFTGAYVGMDAGLGALLLFGTVQVTMFLGAAMARETLPALRVVGAGIALAGLVYLVWPWQAIAQSQINIVMMVLAGIGWGIYSLAGKGSTSALADTAVNFAGAALVFPLLMWAATVDPQTIITPRGASLAVVSGAVTSGLGYALWYAILPRLGASIGAVTQLTVPPIALVAGVSILAEDLTAKAMISTIVVLGGVALSILGPAYLVKRSKAS